MVIKISCFYFKWLYPAFLFWKYYMSWCNDLQVSFFIPNYFINLSYIVRIILNVFKYIPDINSINLWSLVNNNSYNIRIASILNSFDRCLIIIAHNFEIELIKTFISYLLGKIDILNVIEIPHEKILLIDEEVTCCFCNIYKCFAIKFA